MTRVVAVGAGRMGRGIAQVFAYAGMPVTLLDMKHRDAADRVCLLDEARDEIRRNLSFMAERGVFEVNRIEAILALVKTAGPDQASAALSDVEVVFEAVPETIEAKRETLARLIPLISEDVVIASTTSTIPVDDLAALVARPERFLNAHWLNPAYLIPLVEVSPSTDTAPEITDWLCALLEQVGKVPVRCKASPGYIIPRIQAIAMNEAARMVDEGVASAKDIDKAIRYGFGIRYATMGIIEFIDWGGCDILFHASRHLSTGLSSDRHAAAPIVERHMAEGKLGMNAGEGFYDFKNIDVENYRRGKLAEFIALLKHLELLPKPGKGISPKEDSL